MNNKLWDDVSVGDELPVQIFPVSWRTLMTELVATRDFMPYHYHPTYAKSLGMRGAFVNTVFNMCLFGRFVTDWSGPDSDFRSQTLQMLNQTVPGDVLRITGKVIKKWEEAGDSLVEIDIEFRHDLGVAAISTVVLAMPSKQHGPVRLRQLPAPAKVELDPNMPAAGRALLGKPVIRPAPYPVSEAQIMHHAEMARDLNPLYSDSEYARNSRYGGMIAPPPGVQTWAVDAVNQFGIDSDFPDPDLPDQPAWPFAVEKNRIFNIRLPGVKEIIVQKTLLEFGVALRPGDRLTDRTEVINCSAPKQTRRGLGYFVTFLSVFSNQRGDVAGRSTLTLLQYASPDQASAS